MALAFATFKQCFKVASRELINIRINSFGGNSYLEDWC